MTPAILDWMRPMSAFSSRRRARLLGPVPINGSSRACLRASRASRRSRRSCRRSARVGSGVGSGVGFDISSGVGFGVGSGVGAGVGSGVGAQTEILLRRFPNLHVTGVGNEERKSAEDEIVVI